MRQQDVTRANCLFREILNQLRNEFIRKKNWHFLINRTRNRLFKSEMSSFDKILRLYFIRRQMTNYNMKQLTRLKTLVIRVNFENDDVEIKNAKENDADELFKTIFFVINAKMMLIRNICTFESLVNEVMNMIHNILWNDDVFDLLRIIFIVVMMQVDDYVDVACVNIDDQMMIFIIFVLSTFELNNIICHRKQLSLKLVFVIIVHKSQNLTLFKAVIFLSRKSVDFTNVYVVLSKVQNYNNFAIKESFFHDVFSKVISSKIIVWLKNDYLRRNLDHLIKQLFDLKKIKAKQKIKTKQKKRIRSEASVVKDFKEVLNSFSTYFELSSYEFSFVNFLIVIFDDLSSSPFLNFLILIEIVRNLFVKRFEKNTNCQRAKRKLFKTLIN